MCQADRPDEGAAENEPGGITNGVFEKKLSFPKHMCEDVIRDFKSPGSDAESRANWIWKLREEVTANNIAKQ